MRLYDRLFRVPFPGARNPWGARGDAAAAEPEAPTKPVVVAGDDDDEPEVAERNYLDDLNPDSKRVIAAYVEAALAARRLLNRASSSSGTATSLPTSRITCRASPSTTAP